MMEDESGFLSKDDDNKLNVFKVLNKVLTDLNQTKMTTIIEGETTIYLKIVSHLSDPMPVYDHLVPFLSPQYKEVPIDAWDLTTQQVELRSFQSFRGYALLIPNDPYPLRCCPT